MRIVSIRFAVIAILLVLLIFSYVELRGGKAAWSFVGATTFATSCESGYLCVHFLDVGQGDATFIESPSGTQVLIDGGPGSGVLRALGTHMGFFDRSIDMVIATHSDADHIGGLVDIFERYEVASVLRTRNESDSPVSTAFTASLNAEDAHVTIARSGQVFDIGGGVVLEVLFPDGDASAYESNTSSIIVRLVYGEHEFMLTGDAPASVEEHLVHRYGAALASDVLKIGHHGSKTSTAETFVSAVDPDYGVISVGRDNRYGHPHESVLDRLSQHDINVLSTAANETVTFISDGDTLTVR